MISKKHQSLANKLFKLSLKKGELDESIVKKILKEIKKYPYSVALGILNAYAKKVKVYYSEKTLIVESVTKLSTIDLKKIQNSLKSQKIYLVENKVNPSILGGLRLKLGDTVFDDSVRSRIEDVAVAIKGH